MPEDTFFDGSFHTGSSFDYLVEDEVYTCEYHLPFYLSIATLGQEVAVGTLCVDVEATENEMEENGFPGYLYNRPFFLSVSFDLVIIPGTGVWLVDTLWKDGRDERRDAERVLHYFERAMGRSREEMPVKLAYFRVSDEPAPRLLGMPESWVYGPDDYPRVAHELISRLPADHPFDEVDDFIRELLACGQWLDSKGPDSIYHDQWEIPTWLARRLANSSVGEAHTSGV